MPCGFFSGFKVTNQGTCCLLTNLIRVIICRSPATEQPRAIPLEEAHDAAQPPKAPHGPHGDHMVPEGHDAATEEGEAVVQAHGTPPEADIGQAEVEMHRDQKLEQLRADAQVCLLSSFGAASLINNRGLH